MSERLEPRRVQQALVAMLFDPAFAALVRAGSVPELSERERALLCEVDPRALATDPHRLARALHVLVEELPVTAAVLGLGVVEGFFASAEFRAGLFARASMTASFGAWLGERALGVGRLEVAMAALRRPPAPQSFAGLACSPHVRGLVVPANTLAFYLRVKGQLQPDPVRALAGWGGRPRPSPPRRGTEGLLVERRADGSLDLGTASAPLVRLLMFAEEPARRTAVEAEAVRLGAAPHEAAELVDGLVADGLLCAHAPE